MSLSQPTINLYYDTLTGYGPIPNTARTYDFSDKGLYPISSTEPSWKFTDKGTPYIPDEEFWSKSMVHRVCMFYHTMQAQGCEINLYSDKTFVDNLFYPIELSFHNTVPVDELKVDCFDNLRKGDLNLLLLYQEEGADIYTMEYVKTVADQFFNMGVPAKNIYIVLGDLNRVYTHFFKPYNIYGIDWWQIKHQLTSKSRQGIKDYSYTSFRNYDNFANENVLNLDANMEFEKTFLCFNGNNRYHRAGLVSELIYRGLNKDGYISYNIYDEPSSNYNQYDNRIIDTSKGEDYINAKAEIIKHINRSKLTLDYKDATFWEDDRRFDENLYYKSAISIVTETFAAHINEIYHNEAHVLWTTEKVWKPIALGHPFIVLGSLNTMMYLQSEGYYTYYDIIDESYDKISNLPTRIDMICDEIERLSQLSKPELKKLIDTVYDFRKKNRELFYRKNHASKFYKLFKEMIYGKEAPFKF